MERNTTFFDQENQYCQNDSTIQNNVQLQFNPYQIPMAFFIKLEQKTFNLYGNTKYPKQPKQTEERKMKPEKSDSLNSDYSTKLQLPNRMVLAQKEKYRSMEQNFQKVQR